MLLSKLHLILRMDVTSLRILHETGLKRTRCCQFAGKYLRDYKKVRLKHWCACRETPYNISRPFSKLDIVYFRKMHWCIRVFFTRKSARFYAFRYKSTPSTALPSMLARMKICKRTRSDYRLFISPNATSHDYTDYNGIVFCVS